MILRALLLRLFNDTEGPKDSTREQREADAKARKEAKERGEDEDQDEEMKDEEDDGGVKIDGDDE